MKYNILLVAPFTSLKGEAYFNRFRYLAKKLIQHGYDVTLVTSNFEHFSKTFRSNSSEDYFEGYNIVMLQERGYKKNVSLARFQSHGDFCKNLQKFLLSNTQKFDLIYAAYPLICTNHILGSYANENNIKFIIDIQDIWPESIAPVLGKSFILFKPFIQLISHRADKAYGYADGLVAVSQTYLNRGLHKATPNYNCVAYIGADIQQIKTIEPITKNKNEFWVMYIGTLSHSYDLKTVVEATKLLHKQYSNIKVFIIGKGKDKAPLEALNKQLDADVIFLDAMPYDTMISYLKQADVGLNAISKYALQSITNKISDYICTQTPVLNSSENKEIVDLVHTNKIGINYHSFDAQDLKEKIEFLYNNQDMLNVYKENLFTLENRFDRNIEYTKIFQMISNLIKDTHV